MKTLTVKNLSIQFDCFNEENNLEATQEIVDSINIILQSQIPDANPQIFASAIDDSDIEVK